MSATKELTGTIIIHVRMERGKSGYYYAKTDELDGLVLSARTQGELKRLIPDAITELYQTCGIKVIVTPVKENNERSTEKWAALPVDIAREKLSHFAHA